MATTTVLGDIVHYQESVDHGSEVHAAMIIAVHEDETADLRVFNGYCLGSMDVKAATQSDEAEPGKFFYPTPPAQKAHKEHKEYSGN